MQKKRMLETARRQFRHCAIPAATAVAVSVLISRLNAPILVLGLLAAGGYACWRGYRIRIVRPEREKEGERR